MSHSIEELWNEPIFHGCSWLRPNAPIPEEDRHQYRSITPLRFVEDNRGYQLAAKANEKFEAKIDNSYKLFIEKQEKRKKYISDLDAANNEILRLQGYIPDITNWFDKLRWNLHLLLLKYKVVI